MLAELGDEDGFNGTGCGLRDVRLRLLPYRAQGPRCYRWLLIRRPAQYIPTRTQLLDDRVFQTLQPARVLRLQRPATSASREQRHRRMDLRAGAAAAQAIVALTAARR